MMRRAAAGLLVFLAAAFLAAGRLAPAHFGTQFRDAPDAGPSARFPLGTDALGRDRLSRILYAGRVSMTCAPAAALLSCAAALAIALAGGGGGFAPRLIAAASDLCLSLPWLFAILAVRAALPLNASPAVTILLTYGLLGALGWAGPCRVLLAAAGRNGRSEFALQARAAGCRGWRVALVQIAPNLLPLVAAQFLLAVPAFLLAEANLGLLGLGIPEPVPSLGGMLRDLENFPRVAAHPVMLAPALLLVLMVGAFHILIPPGENSL